MPAFEYRGIDRAGKDVKGVRDADNEKSLRVLLKRDGIFLTSVGKGARKGGSALSQDVDLAKYFERVTQQDLAVFTRQLATLCKAGIPLVESIAAVSDQVDKPKLRKIVGQIKQDVTEGASLAVAVGRHPETFTPIFTNMIRAGEAGGALEVILRRLAEFQERSQSLRRKVKGAMVYPIVVISVAVGILAFIMMKIVPQFEKIFDDFGSELPAMTQTLINVSNWVVNYWYLIPAIPFGINLIIKGIKMVPYGRFGWDLFILKAPIFGQLVEKNIMSRAARTLGTLLASGVPILEALNITKETSGNMMFEKLFTKVSESIRDGNAIAKPLKEFSVPPFNAVAVFFWTIFLPGIGALLYLTRYKKRVVDDLVVNMVDVGEESGELDTLLYKVADTYDEEVAVLTESLTSLMEPLLIVFLGGAVGFIVIALFMPLIKLITDLS